MRMPHAERIPHVDDRVRLLHGVPNSALGPGQVGVVCSKWSGCDEPVFEVEFASTAESETERKLLTLGQIVLEDDDPRVH